MIEKLLVEVCWKEWGMKLNIGFWILDFVKVGCF